MTDRVVEKRDVEKQMEHDQGLIAVLFKDKGQLRSDLAASREETTKLSKRCDDLLATGNALAEQLDTARGVIREYRESSVEESHVYCKLVDKYDHRCPICIKADSLLTKPEGTRAR